MKFKSFLRKIVKWGAIVVGCVIVVIAICYIVVSANASGRTFDNVDDIPHTRVALFLATSPVTRLGAHNYYFENRIRKADELYKAGKVDYIIASGGDYTKSGKYGCDEPKAILDSLVKRGIPAERIILDYEGTRTLNSIAKAKEVYGLDSVTIISQQYHNQRAIYLADRYGLHAVGYNAPPSPIFRNRVKNTLREFLARVKLFMDIATDKSPTIKPDTIPIGE